MDTKPDRLIAYLEQALRIDLPVAPFEQVQDSQIQWVIRQLEGISESKGISESIRILDYGCGNLRLLNAISQHRLHDRIHLLATDKSTPKIKPSREYRYEFIDIHEIPSLNVRTLDAVVLMNIAHELSLLEFADSVESSRRLLKTGGTLLFVDMAILPEGEFRALPYYPWEICSLFQEPSDASYASKSGVPVVAAAVPKEGIPIYAQFLDRLCRLVIEKRDYYCMLACVLPYRQEKPEIKRILSRFSLNQNDVHDLGYLMLMSGLANFRILEHLHERSKPSYEQVSNAAEAILRFFFMNWESHKSYPTFFEILDELGSLHSYRAISHAVGYMSGGLPAFFFYLSRDNLGDSELLPTEDLDVFEDHYEYKHIAELGLGNLLSECHHRIEPEYIHSLSCLRANKWMHWT